MSRHRAAAGVLLWLLPAAARAIAAVASAQLPDPAMQLSWQVSRPAASEAERDLLRREYRLSQSSGEFWAAFDGLNARIHATTELLRRLLADNRGGGRQGFPVSVVAEILLLEDILNDRSAGQA